MKWYEKLAVMFDQYTPAHVVKLEWSAERTRALSELVEDPDMKRAIGATASAARALSSAIQLYHFDKETKV